MIRLQKEMCKFEKISKLIEINRALRSTIIWAINEEEVEETQRKIALNYIEITKLKGDD